MLCCRALRFIKLKAFSVSTIGIVNYWSTISISIVINSLYLCCSKGEMCLHLCYKGYETTCGKERYIDFGYGSVIKNM